MQCGPLLQTWSGLMHLFSPGPVWGCSDGVSDGDGVADAGDPGRQRQAGTVRSII